MAENRRYFRFACRCEELGGMAADEMRRVLQAGGEHVCVAYGNRQA